MMFFKSIRLRIFSSVLSSVEVSYAKVFHLLVVSDDHELNEPLLFLTFDFNVSRASTETRLQIKLKVS